MNYRRKKISLKEQLEEAIEEIGDESLQGSGFERETPEERFSGIEPGASELRQPHAQTQRLERGIGLFEMTRTRGPEPTGF
jgi:hypothetical protein